MSDNPRYVFDTNAIVSALLFEQSTPARAFYAAMERGEILACPKLVAELAVSGKADCIITGDQDLLVLHPFRKIPILTPAQFLKWPIPW